MNEASKIVYVCSTPSTAFLHGVRFRELPKRQCELSWCADTGSGDNANIALVFSRVQTFKCTYHYAIPIEKYTLAYDKLVVLQESECLREVRARLSAHHEESPQRLKHFLICFDDGPLYEFFAEDFEVSEAITR